MQLYALGVDDNKRSVSTMVEIKLSAVSATESLRARQPGVLWRLGPRVASTISRTSKGYTSASGPYEMHMGGAPHFVGVIAGFSEITTQDGALWRFSAGEFHYVAPGALHHQSPVPCVTMNLVMPGTPADTGPLVLK